MSNGESFGQQVRNRRRKLDLTQEELAHRAGCAPITVRKTEHDDLRPSIQVAERLAMALNVPLEARAAFVRLARTARAPEPPTPTPAPTAEEIGLEDLSGRAIRGYALGERLGTGGMGVVYRATQPLVEREVAVKIILPKYANQPDFIRRFEAEAQLIARLEHPHIVPLYDYWREPGVAYIVMRLLRGGSVRTLLEGRLLPLEMVDRLMEQICQALAAAHRVGVVHRDLKPANILLDEDHNAYLADFGIAKNLGNFDNLTLPDAVLGLPNYISPEQIRSEYIRPQTDIYCLGVMLYELLTGALPFQAPTPLDVMHNHLTAPLPLLAAHRAGLPAGLDKVIAQATAKDPLDRYPDVDTMFAEWRQALGSPAAAAARVSVSARALVDADNPYKGLRAFAEGDAADFFGRNALSDQLLSRLGEGGDLARFLAVVGPSGCGKSSVVRAGLIPALRRGGLPGSDKWFIVELQPGVHPLEALEAALLRIAVNPPDSLLGQLRDDKRGLLRAAHRCLPADPEVELVLVIDQFEELFTLAPDEAVRAHLLDSLVAAVLDERSRLRIVVTLRADFIDRPLNYMDFGEMLRQRMELVLPFTPDELERAIVGPAERVGAEWEPGLVADIMHDVGDQPGALPLLQYALTGLFEKRDGRRLTHAGYQAIGGVLGALGRRAEEVFTSLAEPSQALARQLFLRLATLGDGIGDGTQSPDTRRRVLRSELMSVVAPALNPGLSLWEQEHTRTPLPGDPKAVGGRLRSAQRSEGQMAAVIEAFGKQRLLSFDRDPVTRGPTVEVAHEALLREWPRLQGWLSVSRSDVRLQRQLAAAALEWQSANRDAGFLLAGSRLAQFEGWAAGTDVALTQSERAFLNASLTQRQAQAAAEAQRQQKELKAMQKLAETEKQRAEDQTQAATSLRARNRLLTAVGGVALVAAIVAAFFGYTSDQNLAIANKNAATAQAASTQAVAQAHLAFSRQLLVQGASLKDKQPDLALLLDAEANNAADTFEARDNLLAGLQRSPRLPTFLRVRGDAINDPAFSPDGKTLAVATCKDFAIGKDCDGGDIILWDMRDPGQARPLGKSLTDDASWFGFQVAFSPDGKTLAAGGCEVSGDSCSQDETRLWDVSDPAQVKPLGAPLTNHTDGVTFVAFSPDGRTLATESEDDHLILWDVRDPAQPEPLGAPLTNHASYAATMTFSPDGKILAATECMATDNKNNCVQGQISLWDVADPAAAKPLGAPIAGPAYVAVTVAFSPDGKTLAAGTCRQEHSKPTCLAGELSLWDMRDPAHAKALGAPTTLNTGIMGLLFSPDGKTVATSSEDGTVRLWDVSDPTQATAVGAPLTGHTNWATGLAFSPDGKTLASGGVDGNLILWDMSDPGQTKPPLDVSIIHDTAPVKSVAFSSDGKTLVFGSQNETISLWDISNVAEAKPLGASLTGHTSGVWSVALSPDGKTLASGSQDNTIRLWDVSNPAQARLLGAPLTSSNQVESVAFSPDGKTLASGNWDSTIQLWNVSDPTQAKPLGAPLTGHTDGVTSVAFRPDGKTLASGSQDHTIRLWDMSDPVQAKPLGAPLTGNADVVHSVAYSPDGKTLASGGCGKRDQSSLTCSQGQIILWDVNDPARAKPLGMPPTNQTNYVTSVAFSPDGKMLASGSWDATVLLWDVSDPAHAKPLSAPLTGHTGGVNSVAFSPDGKTLASGGCGNNAAGSCTQGEIILWDMSVASWEARACRIANRNLTQAEWQQYMGDVPYRQTCPEVP